MRAVSVAVMCGIAAAGAGCSDGGMTGNGVVAGTWGSSRAGLQVSGGAATLQITADGRCYGSYAGTTQPIPAGSSSLAGTFTQLIGAYPGSVQYPAQLAGTVNGNVMSLTITVPALQQTMGPFGLVRGVTATWPPCAYP